MISVTELPIVTEVSGLLENELPPMLVTEFGITTEVRLVPKKATAPILVTELPRVSEVIGAESNA